EDQKDLKNLNANISLEIGSGSGCVSSFIAGILGPSVRALHASQRSGSSLISTLATGLQNKVVLDPINTSFALPLATRLRHSVDVILFNPPYVPTITEEASDAQDTRGISGSWAGGIDGMNVTDVFLERVEELLSQRGRFYLVAVAENNVPAIRERMSRLYGLQSDIVLSRRAGREHLSVLRFIRDPSKLIS
ncbi:hypothetical protein H0H93_014915, partial [Arthromyces matolae]